MSEFLFKVSDKPSRPRLGAQLRHGLREQLLIHKLNSSWGYAILTGLSFLLAYQAGHRGVGPTLGLLAGIVLVPALIAAMLQPRFSLYMVLGVGFLVPGIDRLLPELAASGLIDLILILGMFGIFIRQTQVRNWWFAYSPLTLAVLLWWAYSCFQLLNPTSPGLEAWMYAVRGQSAWMVLFILGLYGLDDLLHIRRLVRLWVGLALLAGAYGLLQAYRGLQGFEWQWAMSDADLFEKVYTWGELRVFSFLSDPTILGVLMAVSTLFCLVFVLSDWVKTWQKVLLGLGSVVMIAAMVYSGTRTAFLVLPIGFGFVVLLNPRRKWIMTGLAGLILAVSLLFLPSENVYLRRFQSAFFPLQAQSVQVRLKNQAYIQPYVQAHPIGAGMGSTGSWGQRFAPETMLSMFPPDSGYVRIAVEMGWIGLLLYCGLLGTVLWVGVRNYFRTRDPRLRTYYLGFLGVTMTLIVAHYPQQVLFDPPLSLIFFLSMAAIVRLRQFSPMAESSDRLD